jgi:proline iminopeptidase
MLFDPRPDVCAAAARAWCDWEDVHVSLTPGHIPTPVSRNPMFRLCFARLVTHYGRHAAFLEPDQLIHDAERLAGIPGVLIQGRCDVSGPLESAWRLSRRWRESRLVIVDDAGHGGGPSFTGAIVSALGQLAGR